MRTPSSRGWSSRTVKLSRTLKTALLPSAIALIAGVSATASVGADVASAHTPIAHTSGAHKSTSSRRHSKRAAHTSRTCHSTRCRDAKTAAQHKSSKSGKSSVKSAGHRRSGSSTTGSSPSKSGSTGAGTTGSGSTTGSGAKVPVVSPPTPTPPTPTPVPTPTPPTPTPAPEPAPSANGWDGFGVGSMPGATWRPYSASSPFNIGVGGATVSPQSSQIVSRILQWNLPQNMTLGVSETTEDFAHPVYYAQPTDPTYTLNATAPWGTNSLQGMKIPIPSDARPAGGSDGHMTVVTPDGWEYDFWQVSSKPNGGGTLSFAWGGRLRIDGNGLGGGATAADFGALAGIVRPQELEAGQINHALFIVLKCTSAGTSFGFGTKAAAAGEGGGSYVYPAGKGGSTCSGESEAGLPPMGTWFTLALSDEQIAALQVPSWKKTILRALAHYGGFVGDTGGSGFGIQMESGSSYTSFGETDPWITFAKKNNLPQWNSRYVMNLSEGVEWQKDLRVLTPPAS